MSSTNIIHTKNVKALQHPCSSEVLNFQNNNNEKLIIFGCYEQIKDEYRIGSVEFFRAKLNENNKEFNFEEDENEESIKNNLSNRWNIERNGRIKCDGGVLDVKVSNNHVLTALSTETLNIYELNSSVETNQEEEIELNKNINLKYSATKQDEGLFLSVDYYNDLEQIVVSTQNSSIIAYSPSSSSELEETIEINNCHSMFGENMPAWIVTQSKLNKNLIMSGGDDCLMKLWDLRSGSGDCPSVLATSKIHEAGVTCGQFHPNFEHIFVSGSYDESVCVWDSRNIKKPLIQIATGGGVWRTKWLDSDSLLLPSSISSESNEYKSYLATANMQTGSTIYEFSFLTSLEDEEIKENLPKKIINKNVKSITNLNKSFFTDLLPNHLSYGIEFFDFFINKKLNKNFSSVASCSFYDDQIDFWTGSF